MLETFRILQDSVQANTKRLMYQLMVINIFIIIMDLGLECVSLYTIETITMPVFYSIKLKLEFAILGKFGRLLVARLLKDTGVSL